MTTDSTVGETASQGSWTKAHWDALQAAESVALVLESSTHDLNVFSDYSKKEIARPEHEKKWIACEHVYFSSTSNHRLWARPFPRTAPGGVCLWKTDWAVLKDSFITSWMDKILSSAVLHYRIQKEQVKLSRSNTRFRTPVTFKCLPPIQYSIKFRFALIRNLTLKGNHIQNPPSLLVTDICICINVFKVNMYLFVLYLKYLLFSVFSSKYIYRKLLQLLPEFI